MRLFLLVFLVFMISCSDSYRKLQSTYKFKSENGLPDYSKLDYWSAHPWKKDPSDSIPYHLRNEGRDSAADVFFLHPTTFTKRKKHKPSNASIDDPYLSAKTDYTATLYQASVFNQHCRIFAPRYRQAHIKTFYANQDASTDSIFNTAYEDVKAAFEYYLDHWNHGRPIIIASHSQGSKLAERLIKDFFENKPLKKQLVVAYIPGWPVPKDYFSSMEMCHDSMQTGCLCSWRTFRTGFIPYYLKRENGNAYATNPLTWTTDSTYAPRSANEGSVLIRFNKFFQHTTDAQVNNGLLYVHRPKFPGSFLLVTRNYHPGDINLFYYSIRRNVAQRIRSFNH